MSEITICTSIAPRNLDKQRQAIQSWKESGFAVISCNSGEEIELLKDYFKDVEFVEMKNLTTRNNNEKKLPVIRDMLRATVGRSGDVCGFSNSDIHFRGITSDMLNFIEESAVSGFVYLKRHEINDLSCIAKMEWDIHFDGIDTFFMNKKYINILWNDGFRVQSAFDRVILTKCRMNSVPIKELINPVAFHISHPQVWVYSDQVKLLEDFAANNHIDASNIDKFLLDDFYNISLNIAEKICFSLNTDVNISISYASYIETMPEFEKYIRWICECGVFDFKELRIDPFFYEYNSGEYKVCALDRCVSRLKEIRELICVPPVIVKRNDGIDFKEIICPYVYKILSRDDCFITNKRIADFYIMPAGIRASEWWNNNKQTLDLKLMHGFLDNKKENIRIDGYLIRNSSFIINNEYNIDIIIASKYYHQDIKRSLEPYKKCINHVYDASNIIMVKKNTMLYFDNELYADYIKKLDTRTL